MKTTLYMAISINGIIARENGDEDFLSHENWEMFCGLARDTGNFIVGRKTYEAVKKWSDGYNFDDLIGVEKVVISQDKSFIIADGYMLAESPRDALAKLAQKGFKKALVTGGSNINSAFAKESLLDEIILNVEPVVIGRGIPLFAPTDFDLKAELISSDTSKSGILTLKYSILK